MTDPERFILLGEIGAAHGIRGEVTLRTFTSQPSDIAAYGPLSDKAGSRTFTISGVRATAKGVIAKFKGVDDRNAAETLRNTKLYVKRSRLPEPAPGEFYHEDLIGLHAIDRSGGVLGTVAGVLNYGAGDLIEISRPGERETMLVPFTLACVPVVDLIGGSVTIVVPEFAEADDEPEVGDIEEQD